MYTHHPPEQFSLVTRAERRWPSADETDLKRHSDRLRARQSDAGGDMGASGGAGGAF